VFASQKQSIAIWHGTRIENHLAEWIKKTSDWDAKKRKRISIAGEIFEIDNLAWNKRLDIVLAVEAKRIWANQDDASEKDVRRNFTIYSDPSATQVIISRVGMAASDFRSFVFDVYGDTKKGSRGLSVIAGDKIENIFGNTFSSYVQWERKVMSNAIFEKLDSKSQDTEHEEGLKTKILNGSLTSGKSKQDVLDYIDSHAN
jgi:hypothetical protein